MKAVVVCSVVVIVDGAGVVGVVVESVGPVCLLTLAAVAAVAVARRR